MNSTEQSCCSSIDMFLYYRSQFLPWQVVTAIFFPVLIFCLNILRLMGLICTSSQELPYQSCSIPSRSLCLSWFGYGPVHGVLTLKIAIAVATSCRTGDHLFLLAILKEWQETAA